MKKSSVWKLFGIYITLSIIVAIIFTVTATKITDDRVNEIKTEYDKVRQELKEEKEKVLEFEKENLELQEKVNQLLALRTDVPYRLTSYYTGEGAGSCTGSGLCIDKFQINEKGWYTYDGALVLAGATQECLNVKTGNGCGQWNTPKEGRKYFKYRDRIKVKIDGVEYEGIILDSCGASMFLNENRLDIFVSSKEYVVDRGYKGRNPILVSW